MKREQWLFIGLLCALGFFVSFKPSEPFIVPYLVEVKNFTENQVNNDIFPVWTYSYFVALAVCGIISEVFNYKSVVILGSLGHLATRLLLLFGTNLAAMQAMQMTFGVASGAEIIFYSYVYILVPRESYQTATAFTRSAILLGHFGSALVGQLLVNAKTPLIVLFYIALGTVSVGTIISLFIPHRTAEWAAKERSRIPQRKYSVDSKDTALRDRLIVNSDSPPLDEAMRDFASSRTRLTETRTDRLLNAIKGYWKDIRTSYSSSWVLGWSLWLWCAWAVHELVLNYITSLFYYLDPTLDYNGFVVAGGRVWASICALIPSIPYLANSFTVPGRACIASVLMMVLSTGLMFCLGYIDSLFATYALYIAYFGFMEFGLSVAWAQLALNLPSERYATIFTFNTLISLAVQTVIQIVTGSKVLQLVIDVRFRVFAVVLAISCGVTALCFVVVHFREKKRVRSLDFELPE